MASVALPVRAPTRALGRVYNAAIQVVALILCFVVGLAWIVLYVVNVPIEAFLKHVTHRLDTYHAVIWMQEHGRL